MWAPIDLPLSHENLKMTSSNDGDVINHDARNTWPTIHALSTVVNSTITSLVLPCWYTHVTNNTCIVNRNHESCHLTRVYCVLTCALACALLWVGGSVEGWRAAEGRSKSRRGEVAVFRLFCLFAQSMGRFSIVHQMMHECGWVGFGRFGLRCKVARNPKQRWRATR